VPGDLADGIGRLRLVHIRYGRVQLVAGERIPRVGVDDRNIVSRYAVYVSTVIR
jgi:hypothetical protein